MTDELEKEENTNIDEGAVISDDFFDTDDTVAEDDLLNETISEEDGESEDDYIKAFDDHDDNY